MISMYVKPILAQFEFTNKRIAHTKNIELYISEAS